MKSFRLILHSAAALAIIALAIPSPSLAANVTTLDPGSVTNLPGFGMTVGSMSSLNHPSDQSGSDDDPAKYVQLQPLGKKSYRAVFAFAPLPDTIHRYAVQGIQVQANYRAQQSLTYSIFNWRTHKWAKVGKVKATAGVWAPISLPVKYKQQFSDFVDPATRQVQVRLLVSNAKSIAALDSLSVAIVSPDIVAAPQVGGCDIFDTDNVWNARVDMLPVDKASKKYVASLGKTTGLHPDFGSGTWDGYPIGIPFNVATNGTSTPTSFDFWYPDESDAGPYPVIASPAVEPPGDSHMLTVNSNNCNLYELYAYEADGPNTAGSGAIWNLASNNMRPDGWTSGDAAGLPILPGLARYDEVASGRINHALRFTSNIIRDTYIWPASHHATCHATATNKKAPPMGQRFRLKASFNISGYSHDTQVILTALKEYGMILADCGSSWYISGAPDPGWDNDALVSELRTVTGSNFEAVNESSIQAAPNSYAITP